jgi:hypothetical protein
MNGLLIAPGKICHRNALLMQQPLAGFERHLRIFLVVRIGMRVDPVNVSRTVCTINKCLAARQTRTRFVNQHKPESRIIYRTCSQIGANNLIRLFIL